MKTIILLLLASCGCAVRYSESQVAHWHGYAKSERVPKAEIYAQERCYQHPGQEVRCFDLGLDTDVSFEVVP